MAIGKKPTAKQVAWRKKFGRMAKAGLFRNPSKKKTANPKKAAPKKLVARKAANPRTKKKPVTVRRNGKKLYGAAAAAVLKSRGKRSNPKRTSATKRPVARRKNSLHKDASHTIAVRKYFRSGGRLTAWKDAEKRGQQRLFSMNPRRRRNSATGDLFEEFRGYDSKEDLNLFVPNDAPRDLYALGGLASLVTEGETFTFDTGEAYLTADKKGKLHIAGDVTLEPNTDFGDLIELSYIAVKEHINPGQEIEYVHELGEEGGQLPYLCTDGEGLLHIKGGDYWISPDGIVD